MLENAKKIRIDLSGRPKENVEDVVLRWAVQVGKIIIVTTELIALAALFFRFTIDRKIIDLNDKIKRADLFVGSQMNKEIEYRSLQKRLSYIKSLSDETEQKIDVMNTIIAVVNSGTFSSTNIVLNQNTISLSGTSISIFPINNLINTVKKNNNITGISIDELASTNQGVTFKVTMDIKTDKKL